MPMEYEVSIRIDFPTNISEALRREKERFVAEYGSGYKSEPHITGWAVFSNQEMSPK
jgi:hypothetical protein